MKGFEMNELLKKIRSTIDDCSGELFAKHRVAAAFELGYALALVDVALETCKEPGSVSKRD